MAHFVKLNENNIEDKVVAVANDIPTSNGPLGENDMHVDGETWCQNFFKGGTWKQTSYHDNFRGRYAGIGFTYDAEKDKFIEPQPHASWTLDANGDWQAPITYPTIIDDGVDPSVWHYLIIWNETKYQADNNTGWEARKSNDNVAFSEKAVYNWNGTTWVSE
jgi:hypothetical protein